jgi:hypothetical protein
MTRKNNVKTETDKLHAEVVGSITRFIEAHAKGNKRDAQTWCDYAREKMQAAINAMPAGRKGVSTKRE